MEAKKVTIDYDKLMKELENRGKTRKWLSLELGRNETYVSCMRKNPERTEQEEKLICMILGLEPGSLIQSDDDKPKKLSEEILRILRKQQKTIDEQNELLEKIYSKLNTNTIQLERIRDSLSKTNGKELAVSFLKDALSGGRLNANVIFARSDEAGIAREELAYAKKELGVEVDVQGYGKNQKIWWYIPG